MVLNINMCFFVINKIYWKKTKQKKSNKLTFNNRIAELVPNGTPKAASPLATVSYPCYSEPVLIRPFDQSELEKLQRGLSSGQLFSGSDSQSSLNSLDRRSSDSVLKLEKRASLVVGVGEVNEQHVMRIYFEGFKDLTMLTMPMREGETCGDFRQSNRSKKSNLIQSR